MRLKLKIFVVTWKAYSRANEPRLAEITGWSWMLIGPEGSMVFVSHPVEEADSLKVIDSLVAVGVDFAMRDFDVDLDAQ